jgi:hypothetical protein
VIETLDRYAVALDARLELSIVFTPDAIADFGSTAARTATNRKLIRTCSAAADRHCMLGVYRIEISGDEATSMFDYARHIVGPGALSTSAASTTTSSSERPRAGASATGPCGSHTRRARARS